jgi:SAM-dependent methyltransferase
VQQTSPVEFRPTDEALTYLLSGEGSALLAELATASLDEGNLLALTTRLRARYPRSVVAAALDLALLRVRAEAKFARASEMVFTREALEQASAEVVSRYRARRHAGYPGVADLCCGIGGDALALAEQGKVFAVDVDPLRLRMAAVNVAVYGHAGRLRTTCADVRTCELPVGYALWADPSRRVGGRRVFALSQYEPPLPHLLAHATRAPGAGIKLSPGVDYAELAGLVGDAEHELEIISVQGEAREAVLWLGELATTRRRATLLPGGQTLVERPLPEPVPVEAVGCYLYEPDAAVIRAHLVEHLAADAGMHKIDPQIAYLSSNALIETPFAVAYEVEEAMPFGLKRIRARLRALDPGELVIKKRGIGIDPAQFRRELKHKGGDGAQMVLILTRVQERPVALICRAVGQSTDLAPAVEKRERG